MSFSLKVQSLIGLCVAIVVGVFVFKGPVPQSLCYHYFADTRGWLGLVNFGNVISNLAYLIPGLMGLYLIQGRILDKKTFLDAREALPFYVVFIGSVLLAFGSGFYHLVPGNETLVADRLTMTVGFMGVLSFVIVERISLRWGLKLLPLLLVIGLASVVSWIYTETLGAGDLRFYGLVQFLPLAAIVFMLVAFPARYTGVKYIWLALLMYALAKGFETWDIETLNALGGTISGHTLKHLISGLGIYFLVLYLGNRRPV